HVDQRAVGALRVRGIGAAGAAVLGIPDETGHRAVSDAGREGGGVVRAAGVLVGGQGIRFDAHAGFRIVVANGGHALRVHGNALGAGNRSEVVIDRAVLLHDHDDVLDAVLRGGAAGTAGAARTARTAGAARATGAASVRNIIATTGEKNRAKKHTKAHESPQN